MITSRWFDLPDHVRNHTEMSRLKFDLLNKTHWHYTIVAGRRSFKTERFAKRYIVSEAINNDNHNYFATAPTRLQAKDIFWKDLKELVPVYLIKSISETELRITLTNGTFIKVAGMEAYKRIEGTPAHGIIFSEYQETDPEGYYALQPMVIDTKGWVIKEGRPIGKNHFYDDYMRGLSNEAGYGSYHWISADVLTPEQIELAKRDLSKEDFAREYEASFDTKNSNAYYSYSELNNNTDYLLNPALPIIVTCDFNATVKPMSWVVGQRVNKEGIDMTFWLKTFSFQYTNTETMCDIVIEYLQQYKSNNKLHLIFYGDYAGRQVKSNSSFSDWEIIRNKFRNFCTYEEKVRPCLSIRDSIASTNAQLCNSFDLRRQFVNPKECKPLIEDWTKCEYKDNSRELKDNNDLLGHLCRAIDYYNFYEHSIKGKIQVTEMSR